MINSYTISALLNWICFNTQCVVGATQILPTALWDLFFMDKEVWKDISWYEWLYQVSNLWNVKSLKYNHTNREKILSVKWSLYYMFWLCWKWSKKHKTVHRIVAKEFIPNPESKPEVNHINGIKTDNRVENLEWCTKSENWMHAYKMWLSKAPHTWKLWKNHHCSKAVLQYDLKWNFIKEWWWMRDIKRAIWINNGRISECCNWKRENFWWYIWKKKEQKQLKEYAQDLFSN